MKIAPCIWFDDQAEPAARFYVETFRAIGHEAAIVNISRYGAGMPRPAGSVLAVSFTLAGQDYTALNGGPAFPLTPAISLAARCKDQAEIDALWEALTADGGAPSQCGWLTDRFGLSWQIVPEMFVSMMERGSRAQSDAMMSAIMGMVKLDIGEIRRAYEAAA